MTLEIVGNVSWATCAAAGPAAAAGATGGTKGWAADNDDANGGEDGDDEAMSGTPAEASGGVADVEV